MMRDEGEEPPSRLKRVPKPAKQPIASDNKATEEAKALAHGDLESEAKANEHGRNENFKNHVSVAAIIVFWCLVFCGCIAGFIAFIHLVSPEKFHFLSQVQLDQIKALLTGVITTALLNYIQGRVK